MKQQIIIRLALVTVALAFSLLVFTRDGVTNVSPCAMVPGCVPANNGVVGTYIKVRNGFPVAYKETGIFRPTKGANYKEARLTQEGVNVTAIILDAIFWYALLELLLRIRTSIREKYRPRLSSDHPTAGTPDQPSK